MPSPKESSPPRDQTCFSYVFCIGRGVLTTSTAWEFPRHNQNFKRKKKESKMTSKSSEAVTEVTDINQGK